MPVTRISRGTLDAEGVEGGDDASSSGVVGANESIRLEPVERSAQEFRICGVTENDQVFTTEEAHGVQRFLVAGDAPEYCGGGAGAGEKGRAAGAEADEMPSDHVAGGAVVDADKIMRGAGRVALIASIQQDEGDACGVELGGNLTVDLIFA